jgi:hypothetical protein
MARCFIWLLGSALSSILASPASADPKTVFFQAQTARPTSSAICSRPRHQALTRRRDAASARRSVFVERKCDLHARSQPPRCDAAGLSKRHMMCGNYWAEHGYLACCRTVLGPAAMPKVLAATPMTTPRRRQREHAASARRPRARSIICVPQRCRSQSHLPAGLVQWRQHHTQRDGLPGPRRHGLSRRARLLSRLRSGMVLGPSLSTSFPVTMCLASGDEDVPRKFCADVAAPLARCRGADRCRDLSRRPP